MTEALPAGTRRTPSYYTVYNTPAELMNSEPAGNLAVTLYQNDGVTSQCTLHGRVGGAWVPLSSVDPASITLLAGSEAQAGTLELATAAETQAGTDTTRAVHPAGLKSATIPLDSHCELTLTANQSIPNAAFTNVAWSAEVRDARGWHDNSVNPERVSPGVAGVYAVTFVSNWALSSTGIRRIRILRNGAQVVGFSAQDAVTFGVSTNTLSAEVYLGATEYVTANVWQNSGGALDLDSALARLTAVRVR